MRRFLKDQTWGLLAVFIGVLAFRATATTYYVDLNSPNPTPPYTNWGTASVDIQSAVNLTTNGDLVLVNPGVYQSGGYMAPDGNLTCVVVTNAITLQGVSGPSATSISGSNAMRCVYLGNNTILEGFTVTNGYLSNIYAQGGGVCCLNSVLTNCTLAGNYAISGPAVYQGTLYRCLLTGNLGGGGTEGAAYESTLNFCVVSNNSSPGAGGVVACLLNNCLVINNSGYDGAAFASTLNNCTVVGNSGSNCGGVYANSTLNNCIVYYNTGPSSNLDNYSQCSVNNSCTTPLPDSGTGNITSPPLFVNITNDFHLQSNSPCINEGNNADVTFTNDLDGNPRIVGGVVDMGAYEFQTPVPLNAGIQVDNTNVLSGFAMTLQALSERGDASYILWDFGDGTTATNQASVVHSWSSPGAYTVTLLISNQFTPGGAQATVTMNVTAQSVFYVDENSPNPVPPYSSWATAATNIQDAVNAACDGGTVLVTDGLYQYGGQTVNGFGLTNRVAINTAITVQSVNGAGKTLIQGYQVPGTTTGSSAVRCVYLNTNAALIGFTLTNGATLASGDSTFEENGGGIFCPGVAGAIVSNCVITANAAVNLAGGAYQGTLLNCTIAKNSSAYGGGADAGTLVNCALFNNSAGYGGAAAYALIFNSTVISNSATGTDGAGGGVYFGTVLNSTLTGNYCGYEGGGAFYANLTNCTIMGNSTSNNGEGGGTYNCDVANSVIAGNSSGTGGGAAAGTLVNCTITGNSASQGGGSFDVSELNCINYFNTVPASDYSPNTFGDFLNYSCTIPLPGGVTGCITNDPQLVSISQISSNSPCRGAGNPVYSSGVDINGNPWANPPSMGCEEPYPGNMPGNLTVNITASGTNIPVGYALNFNANVTGPAYVSTWNFGDGTVASNELYVSHAWSATGNYQVVLTVYNDSYPGGESATNIISVFQPTVFYVNLNNTNPVAPYCYWSTATTNIQTAIGVAPAGSLILVTNSPPAHSTNNVSVYQPLAPTPPPGPPFNFYSVVITNRLTVQSVNGPGKTWITRPSSGSYGCVYVANGATLSGFTLSGGIGNGPPPGGGDVAAASTNAMITNCVITHCLDGPAAGSGTFYNCVFATNTDGAALASTMFNCLISNNTAYDGGGIGGGNLNNCLIVSNTATYGGAVYCASGYPVTLNNCVISNNVAQYGGGVYNGISLTNCTLNNCVIVGNTAGRGGGVYGSWLNHCVVSSNSANEYEGGGADYSVLINCVIATNSSPENGGGASYSALTNCVLMVNRALDGGAAYDSLLVNCTVASNSASGSGGGTYLGTNYNCIVYDNSGPANPNSAGSAFAFCDTIPLPSGAGNITNGPAFINLVGGNFQLQPNSPCINSGNNAYVTSATDLAGNPRIVGGTVDIGAYEYQTPTSVLSYAWLQQYGLPTDGSVDFANLDGTAFNVYQDWVAGLNPTNSASVLAMLIPAATVNTNGITVTWQSVTNIPYFLQRSTNLPTFLTIQNNITGQTNTTSYTDTSATNNFPYLYRVGVTAP